VGENVGMFDIIGGTTVAGWRPGKPMTGFDEAELSRNGVAATVSCRVLWIVGGGGGLMA
jgi:hypothetical protein